MKQKHADSPSAFLAAAMAVTGAAMLLCPLIGQNTEMNRSAAEYDDLRVQLKSEEPAQATDAPAQDKSVLRVLLGFPSATQEPLELPKTYESGLYRIFAVLNFHSGEWDASQADFESDAAFLEFIRYARRNALYDTGVTVGAEDSILTLITCDRSYGGKAGRLAVMAALEKSRRSL